MTVLQAISCRPLSDVSKGGNWVWKGDFARVSVIATLGDGISLKKRNSGRDVLQWRGYEVRTLKWYKG